MIEIEQIQKKVLDVLYDIERKFGIDTYNNVEIHFTHEIIQELIKEIPFKSEAIRELEKTFKPQSYMCFCGRKIIESELNYIDVKGSLPFIEVLDL